METFKGTVQLSGFANLRDQNNRAGDLAKKVTGVKEVVNNITVKKSVNWLRLPPRSSARNAQ